MYGFFFLLDDTCRDDKAYEAFCKDYRDNDFCTKYPYGMNKHCALTCGFCSKSKKQITVNNKHLRGHVRDSGMRSGVLTIAFFKFGSNLNLENKKAFK